MLDSGSIFLHQLRSCVAHVLHMLGSELVQLVVLMHYAGYN